MHFRYQKRICKNRNLDVGFPDYGMRETHYVIEHNVFMSANKNRSEQVNNRNTDKIPPKLKW